MKTTMLPKPGRYSLFGVVVAVCWLSLGCQTSNRSTALEAVPVGQHRNVPPADGVSSTPADVFVAGAPARMIEEDEARAGQAKDNPPLERPQYKDRPMLPSRRRR